MWNYRYSQYQKVISSNILAVKGTYTWGAQDNNIDIYQKENLMAKWFLDGKILIYYLYYGQNINFYLFWSKKFCLSDQFY